MPGFMPYGSGSTPQRPLDEILVEEEAKDRREKAAARALPPEKAAARTFPPD